MVKGIFNGDLEKTKKILLLTVIEYSGTLVDVHYLFQIFELIPNKFSPKK